MTRGAGNFRPPVDMMTSGADTGVAGKVERRVRLDVFLRNCSVML